MSARPALQWESSVPSHFTVIIAITTQYVLTPGFHSRPKRAMFANEVHGTAVDEPGYNKNPEDEETAEPVSHAPKVNLDAAKPVAPPAA